VNGPRRAFIALLPNWVGRTQQMAVAARITAVGARTGFGQGALQGDRQNLHSLIKILGPMLYGSLFAYGCQIGVPALPFLFSAVVGIGAWLLVLLTPTDVWRDPPSDDAAARRADGGAKPAEAPGS
jgi:hypothetical protein